MNHLTGIESSTDTEPRTEDASLKTNLPTRKKKKKQTNKQKDKPYEFRNSKKIGRRGDRVYPFRIVICLVADRRVAEDRSGGIARQRRWSERRQRYFLIFQLFWVSCPGNSIIHCFSLSGCLSGFFVNFFCEDFLNIFFSKYFLNYFFPIILLGRILSGPIFFHGPKKMPHFHFGKLFVKLCMYFKTSQSFFLFKCEFSGELLKLRETPCR